VASSDLPSTIGLDTSVVLRLLTAEPADQADKALGFLRELKAAGRKAFVSDLVVSEAYFALQAHYQVPKKSAVKVLLDFLRSGFVEQEENGASVEALESITVSSQKPGFVGRMIHAQYGKIPAALVTFEKASGKLDGVIVLEA
jgi:predicted nucleic-acid-binding protein